MKFKEIIILGILFGILAFGILLKSWIRSASDSAGAAQGGLVAIAKFDPVKAEKILIGRGSQSSVVEIVRENGAWKVKSLWDAKADPVKVENLIQKLLSLRGELRSSDKKLFKDFGIEDAEAFSIRLSGADNMPLSDFRIGTKQAGENSHFIRNTNGENVYLVDLNMPKLLGIYTIFGGAVPESSFWADLSLFNLDPEKVTEITVDRLASGEMTLVAGLERVTDPNDPLRNAWKFRREGMSSPLDADKVFEFIAMMNSVRAEKVVTPDGKGYGLEKPVWQLAVTEGDKKTALVAGPKDEKGDIFYVKHPGDPTVFALQASFLKDLNVDDMHFIKKVSHAASPSEGRKKTA